MTCSTLAATLILLAAPLQDGPPKLETTEHKASYSLGYQLGKAFGKGVDLDVLRKGLEAALAGKESALKEDDMREAINAVARAKQQKEAELAKADGKKFLVENGKKEGIVTTESGLQYKVDRKGEGANPAATDTVTVHYHGTLTNGTVFDSSVERKEPATFPLNRVIKGWTEGLQLMKVGAKYTFYIPSDLAYGERSPSPKIPPHSTLVFEVELLSIKEK